MSRGTLDHTSSFLVSTTGLLPSMAELSNSLHLRYCIHVVCPQPQRSKLHWFGLFRVRSPLLTESNFFLFLRVLRCFSSPGCPPPGYVFAWRVTSHEARRVFPFGDPRVDGLVPLTADYRSLTRPSSASSAKASTVRPYHLPTRQDGGSRHISIVQMRSC